MLLEIPMGTVGRTSMEDTGSVIQGRTQTDCSMWAEHVSSLFFKDWKINQTYIMAVHTFNFHDLIILCFSNEIANSHDRFCVNHFRAYFSSGITLLGKEKKIIFPSPTLGSFSIILCGCAVDWRKDSRAVTDHNDLWVSPLWNGCLDWIPS